MADKKPAEIQKWITRVFIGFFSFIFFLFLLNILTATIKGFVEDARITEQEKRATKTTYSFIVYPGQSKTIETKGKNFKWNSSTLVGKGWQQNIDVIIHPLKGQAIRYQRVNRNIINDIPKGSLIDKISFNVRYDGFPEEVEFVLINP
jgi:hypothetical protein